MTCGLTIVKLNVDFFQRLFAIIYFTVELKNLVWNECLSRFRRVSLGCILIQKPEYEGRISSCK